MTEPMPDHDDLVERLRAIEEELRDLAYDRLRAVDRGRRRGRGGRREAAAPGPPRDRTRDHRARRARRVVRRLTDDGESGQRRG